MIRAVSSVGISAFLAHQLAKQRPKRYAPRRPHARIAVHRQKVIALLESERTSDGNGFLPVSAEPLRQAPLPDQAKHLLLDRARKEKMAVESRQLRCRIDDGLHLH